MVMAASGIVALRLATPDDEPEILAVINDASIKYKGAIPEDMWKEPYMPAEELRHQSTDAGIAFHVACLASDKMATTRQG